MRVHFNFGTTSLFIIKKHHFLPLIQVKMVLLFMTSLFNLLPRRLLRYLFPNLFLSLPAEPHSPVFQPPHLPCFQFASLPATHSHSRRFSKYQFYHPVKLPCFQFHPSSPLYSRQIPVVHRPHHSRSPPYS